MVIHCTMYVIMIDRKLVFFLCPRLMLGQCGQGVDRGIFFTGPSNVKRLWVVLTNVVVTALIVRHCSSKTLSLMIMMFLIRKKLFVQHGDSIK